MQHFGGGLARRMGAMAFALARPARGGQSRLSMETCMTYQIIAHVENPSTARVLVVALRAHGFHPLEQGEGGLPGVPNLFGPDGVPV